MSFWLPLALPASPHPVSSSATPPHQFLIPLRKSHLKVFFQRTVLAKAPELPSRSRGRTAQICKASTLPYALRTPVAGQLDPGIRISLPDNQIAGAIETWDSRLWLRHSVGR